MAMTRGQMLQAISDSFPSEDELRLVINLETATTLGVTIPPSLLRRADELIE